jgi:hypothetical protein
LFLQLFLLLAEALVALVLVRRWSFVKRAYGEAVYDVWRLRFHVAAERQRLKANRRRGDLWMLRFLRLRPNRWDEVVRMLRFGPPAVSQK